MGGVWINTVETTKLQTPKPAFHFSDFPWPDSVPELFPNQFQVLDYLRSYAHHFDLIKDIKFGTKVLGIKYQGASDEEMQPWCLWGWKWGALQFKREMGVEHPCRVLYRTEHWNVPDYNPWGVPLPYLYLNRFSELMVHKPGEGFLLSLLATILAPLRLAFSKFVESDIEKKLRLAKFVKLPVLASAKKALKFKVRTTRFQGEKNIKDIFESKTFQDHILGSPDAAVPLYRECIHPRIPQLAVIGFSECVANLYTSEMRCRWTAELLDSTFKLPSIKEMESYSAKWDQYLKRYSGRYYRRSCIGALHIWYNDQLCKDMGWNPKRKKGFFAESFEPYGPSDYVSP
ncbi:hypothetical protein OIU77_006382 [Salix suchowensis]|uniref:Flavin-containing monooxygenase n=1 Tax=Salix suchowensis TaxID=1278906 RepID=A0ABQ9AKJ2_9ROSI|nr:hypothetical protein OIU77_006382 [Salix suchowensis]